MARLVTLILLYNGVAGTSLSIDSNLTSTAELVGHVVGTLKDLTCNKMLSVMNIFLHRALKISSKLHQTHLLDTLKKFNLLPPPLLLRAHIRGWKIKGQICQTDNIVYLLFIYWIINAAKIELSFYHGLRPFRSDWYIYKILAEFLCHQLRAFS